MSSYLMKPSNQTPPYSNVNGGYVNKFNTNWPGNFSSRATGKEFGLPEPINKDQAAIPYIKGMGMLWGGGGGGRWVGGNRRKGSKKNKKYNLRKYKMKRTLRGGRPPVHPFAKGRRGSRGKGKSRGRSRSRTRGRGLTRGRGRTRGRSMKQMGGTYHQWQGDTPNTPTYSLGGHLSAANLALANPPPHQTLSNCTNCVDNYNHYTNKGFQFW